MALFGFLIHGPSVRIRPGAPTTFDCLIPMDTLFTGTEYFVEFMTTILILPLLIYLSFFISYGLGKGLNHFFLHGKSFNTLHLLCTFIGGMGFFALGVMILGASFIQVFSISAAEGWYQQVYPIGSIGNNIGIICFVSAGFLKGKNDEE